MKYLLPALLWGLAILVLSILPGGRLPESLQSLLSADKLAHALAYGVFTVLLGWGLQRRSDRPGTARWRAAGAAALYGVTMEIVQFAFFPYRYFELYDILANIIGSIFGLFVLTFFLK